MLSDKDKDYWMKRLFEVEDESELQSEIDQLPPEMQEEVGEFLLTLFSTDVLNQQKPE